MASIIDMHIHTIVGSMDSDISARRLAETAKQVGLSGVGITEHTSPWLVEEVERLRQESGLFVFTAREWTTEVGHIVALGLDGNIRGISRARELRKLAEEQGAYMILCHPFRYFPGPSNFLFGSRYDADKLSVEEMAQHPVFELVDAIEVLNGACIERENQLAQAVARLLSKPGLGGSDAHMPLEIGCYATIFEKDLEREADLLNELRAGRFYAAQRVENGVFAPLGETIRK